MHAQPASLTLLQGTLQKLKNMELINILSTNGRKRRLKIQKKKAKHLTSFAVYVDDAQVYSKDIADAIENDLQPFLASGKLTALTKHDSNPKNNPQPPAHLR